MDVYALTVCTPLHGGNKEIYLSTLKQTDKRTLYKLFFF